MSIPRKLMLLAAAWVAVIGGAFAADAQTPAPAAAAAAKDSAKTKGDLQMLMQQFNARRDALLATHEALLNQLKTATAEQRKAILEKMASDQKELMDAQRAMAKQMRDELRKLRQATPPGGSHR
jgi:hypothetical protein